MLFEEITVVSDIHPSKTIMFPAPHNSPAQAMDGFA
jgi:hypothetical protein